MRGILAGGNLGRWRVSWRTRWRRGSEKGECLMFRAEAFVIYGLKVK